MDTDEMSEKTGTVYFKDSFYEGENIQLTDVPDEVMQKAQGKFLEYGMDGWTWIKYESERREDWYYIHPKQNTVRGFNEIPTSAQRPIPLAPIGTVFDSSPHYLAVDPINKVMIWNIVVE